MTLRDLSACSNTESANLYFTTKLKRPPYLSRGRLSVDFYVFNSTFQLHVLHSVEF